MNYETLVMTTAAVMVGSAEAKSLVEEQKLHGAPVVAGFGLGIFLFIIGMARQDIGVKFCWFIMITAILVNGAALFKALAPNAGTTVAQNKLTFPKG